MAELRTLLLLCCCGLALPLSAQDGPVLRLSIAEDSVGVGQPLSLQLTSDEPLSGGRRWNWPVLQAGDSLAQGWEVIRVGIIDSSASPELDAGLRRSQQIVIMAWDSGMKVIEPLSLTDSAGVAASTDARLMEVGLVPLEADAVPKPMQGFRAFGWTWWERVLAWLPYLLGAMALAWLARWGIRRWQDREPSAEVETVEPEPLVPAHETALAMLRELENGKPWLQGQGKETQVIVSHAIRLHLQGSFGVKALERTTDEVAQSLRQAPVRGLEENDGSWVVDILQRSDLVKFAKQSMDGDAHLRVVQESIAWVERSTPFSPPSGSMTDAANDLAEDQQHG